MGDDTSGLHAFLRDLKAEVQREVAKAQAVPDRRREACRSALRIAVELCTVKH